jgi:hypothetical protein
VRNDHFSDARGFFATQRSVYKQNDFGGSVGGLGLDTFRTMAAITPSSS